MGVLEGLLVIESAGGITGPYCAMELGDAGADVIKVEPPRGDPSRGWGPPFDRGESAVFLGLNRNKRGIVLDRGRSEDQQALRRLLARADVFLEDWGAGGAERDGFEFYDLSQDNPRLVQCSITPYGDRGPFRERAGSELTAQAMGETTTSLGRIGGPPIRMGTDLASMTAGVFAFQSILAALYSRARTGRGQKIDTSMLGSLMFMRSTLWAAHSDPDEWQGFHLDSYVKPPDHAYHASDGQFYVMFPRGLTRERWHEFLEETGMQDHRDDPQFGSYREALGLGRYGYLVQHLWNERFRQNSFDEIRERIERFGGNAWRLNSYSTLFSSPQAEALGLSMDVPHPDGGNFQATGLPWEMHDTPGEVSRPPPSLGQHTMEVLAESGFSKEEIGRLCASNAVGQAESVSVDSGGRGTGGGEDALA